MKLKIRSFLFWLLFGGLTVACDVLNEDTPQEYDVQVLTDKVFVSELQSSSIINLNTLIRAKVPVKFSIAENTHNGTLDVTSINEGIIKYSSPYGVIQPDNFKFSISNTNNETLTQQQVNLVLANEQDDLPCNTVLPFNDHFINLGEPGTVVLLDVLKNDWMCDEMRSQVQISVDDGYGNAAITADNKISYTVPQWDEWSQDRYTWYIITLKSNPAIRWHGLIRLTFDNICEIGAGYVEDNDPNDGMWAYSLPMATASTIKFNPLSTASLCGYSLSDVSVTIIQQPKFGTAQVHPSKSFTYTPSNTGKETYTDLIIYKVSLPNGKWAAQIMKLRLVNGTTCTQGAVDDVVGVENIVMAPGGGLLIPVISNDCNRQAITSITIVTPASYGEAVIGTWFNTWSIKYNLYNDTDKKQDVVEYEANYQDGSKSRAKVYITPYDSHN
jgi:hypothetical protein